MNSNNKGTLRPYSIGLFKAFNKVFKFEFELNKRYAIQK